jgi:hypothetical protein
MKKMGLLQRLVKNEERERKGEEKKKEEEEVSTMPVRGMWHLSTMPVCGVWRWSVCNAKVLFI